MPSGKVYVSWSTDEQSLRDIVRVFTEAARVTGELSFSEFLTWTSTSIH
jgi:hypothetical protein